MSASASQAPKLLLPGQPLSIVSRDSQEPQPVLGTGVYSRGDYLLSSLVGYEARSTDAASSSSSSLSSSSISKSGLKPSASALGTTISIAGIDNRFVVPKPDSIVIGRVTRVTPRQAHLSILIVDGQPCGSSSSTNSTFVQSGPGNHAAGEGEGTDFQGVVRSQDVRNTEKDKVKLADCFRPGDIVRAQVISLGDARSYYLSTAANNLGVIYATSASTSNTSSSSSAASSSSEIAMNAPGPGWDVTGNPMTPISWQQMIDPQTGIIEKRKCAKPDGI